MPWEASVTTASGAVVLALDVTPGAREDRFPDGFDAWRGRIRLRVRAPAQDGRANRAVLDLVAAALGVPRAAVTLEAGATDRRKTVRVEGLDREMILARLGEGMA